MIEMNLLQNGNCVKLVRQREMYVESKDKW